MPVNMKSIIAKTFIDMAKQKGIDKITVKALISFSGSDGSHRMVHGTGPWEDAAGKSQSPQGEGRAERPDFFHIGESDTDSKAYGFTEAKGN